MAEDETNQNWNQGHDQTRKESGILDKMIRWEQTMRQGRAEMRLDWAGPESR